MTAGGEVGAGTDPGTTLRSLGTMDHRTSRRTAALIVAAVAVLTTGCSSDDEADGARRERDRTTTTERVTTSGADADATTTTASTDGPDAGDDGTGDALPPDATTTIVPTAEVVPFEQACAALGDDQVRSAPFGMGEVSIRNATIDETGAACAWQVTGSDGRGATVRVAFESAEEFDSTVGAAGGLERIELGDEAFREAVPGNATVWVKVGDTAVIVDAPTAEVAQDLAAKVLGRL